MGLQEATPRMIANVSWSICFPDCQARLKFPLALGVTTDGSSLYPEPLQLIFPEVPHQICEFHIIKELTKAIVRAVAQVRKRLAAQKPVAKRGRPTTTAAKRIARRRQRLQQKIAEL